MTRAVYLLALRAIHDCADDEALDDTEALIEEAYRPAKEARKMRDPADLVTLRKEINLKRAEIAEAVK